MGLAHLLGLDDGGARYRCRGCRRLVRVDADASDGDGETACPECGSTDLRRLQLL